MKKILSLMLLATVTVFSSCSKDDDDDNSGGSTPASNTSKLCNKNWKLNSVKVAGIETIGSMMACELDNFQTFSADSTYILDEGATLCSVGDPQTVPGVWTWGTTESKLVVDGDTVDVLTNSGTVLKVKIPDPVFGLDTEMTYGL